MVGVKKWRLAVRSAISGGMLMVVAGCATTEKDAAPSCQTSVFPLSTEVFQLSQSQNKPKGNVGRGETLFTSLCSGCHVHGRQSSLAQAIREASGLGAPMPPKLACERFQYSYSEAYVSATIKHGGRPEFKAHSMPAWAGILNDEDIADLVAYIVSIGAPTSDQDP
ncbi:MAG: cytochrome c [Gammaproteobacteria bacterium]